MRIALTGATGGVGKSLVRAARAQGHEVRAIVRDLGRAQDLAQAGVTLVRGDLDDRDALTKVATGADVFIHTAAHVGDVGTREEFEKVNVGGTRNAVEAAARAGVKRFVHLSSTAVYGRPSNGRIDEEYPPRHFGAPYEDTKLDAERIAFTRGKELGLEVTAVRPPIIFGPDDRVFLPRAIRTLRAGRAPLINGGRAPLNLVSVDDVVDVLLRCATRPEAVGQAFNVAADPPPTVRDVFATVASAAGIAMPKISLPYAVAMPLAKLVDTLWKVTRREGPAPLTPFVVTLMTRNVVYDAAKARKLLGWSGGKNVLDALGATARSLAAR
jgi:nucleoside-diphosphate-sugar epimerase